MNQLTQTLAIELAPRGIRANAVAVGIVPTESLRTIGGVDDEQLPAMARSVPLGRLGDPDDVAAAIVYLDSPAVLGDGTDPVVSGGR